jgi:hypothetical protein
MRVRIGSTIAVVAAGFGLAAGVAGPVYAAFGGQATMSSAAAGNVGTSGRIMK